MTDEVTHSLKVNLGEISIEAAGRSEDAVQRLLDYGISRVSDIKEAKRKIG